MIVGQNLRFYFITWFQIYGSCAVWRHSFGCYSGPESGETALNWNSRISVSTSKKMVSFPASMGIRGIFHPVLRLSGTQWISLQTILQCLVFHNLLQGEEKLLQHLCTSQWVRSMIQYTTSLLKAAQLLEASSKVPCLLPNLVAVYPTHSVHDTSYLRLPPGWWVQCSVF